MLFPAGEVAYTVGIQGTGWESPLLVTYRSPRSETPSVHPGRRARWIREVLRLQGLSSIPGEDRIWSKDVGIPASTGFCRLPFAVRHRGASKIVSTLPLPTCLGK